MVFESSVSGWLHLFCAVMENFRNVELSMIKELELCCYEGRNMVNLGKRTHRHG